MSSLTEQVKQRAMELGADLVGVAPVERYKNAPLRMSPQGLFPDARYVVVAGMHHPDAIIELDGEPTSHEMGPYSMQVSGMNNRLDDISFLLARFLEGQGHRTLPISASNIWRYKGYKDLDVHFAPDMAHRYSAVAAGLGEIGWNGLCLSPQFGPRNRFVSVVTEAELEPTPLYRGEPLCDKCKECVKMCPTDAFRKEVREITKVIIEDRVFEFPLTNKWRCAWAENFQLNLAHTIPDTIDEVVIRKYIEKYGVHGGEMGCCLRFCMTPKKRYYDASYSRAPRRRKEPSVTPPLELANKVRQLCRQNQIDIVAISGADVFADDRFVHPAYHLPDARTVICLGLKPPADTAGNPDIQRIMTRKLSYAAFQASHHLDMEGYSATAKTKIPNNLVAKRLGVFAEGVQFETVLTSAELPAGAEPPRSVKAEISDPEGLRRLCLEAGVDLVGFFGKPRYDELVSGLTEARVIPEERALVEDLGGSYGPFVPRSRTEALHIKSLDEWLPGAKSVVVLGLHFPNTAWDMAKVTPAETVGPFAFVHYETLRLLGDYAFGIVKQLNAAGYRANLAYDLTGVASQVRNCRRMLPDMRANLYASILGGLAYQGVHGYPLTREYGSRQKFIAIVTDLSLPDDRLYAGATACSDCSKPCLKACPTAAIKDEPFQLSIAGSQIGLYKFDSFACDWAKRYALAGAEGARYQNIDVNVPVPKAGSVDDIVAAAIGTDWGVQKRLLNIAEECLRTCTARGELT